jgi:hypothetical protein
MYRYKRWQFLAVLAPLLLVEAAAFWKLWGWLTWGYPTGLAFTTALAFISLMLGAIVALSIAMSLDIPQSIRKPLTFGGVALFLCQGFANVLGTYQYGMEAMPTEVMVSFFDFLGMSKEFALKLTAIIQGGILSLVSISFWAILAQMAHNQWKGEQEAKERLKDWQHILEEEDLGYEQMSVPTARAAAATNGPSDSCAVWPLLGDS